MYQLIVGLSIENMKDKKKYTLTEELLNKHFRYGYCATCAFMSRSIH